VRDERVGARPVRREDETRRVALAEAHSRPGARARGREADQSPLGGRHPEAFGIVLEQVLMLADEVLLRRVHVLPNGRIRPV